MIPVLRGKHRPEFTARGVFWGLIVAFTPTVGVQMPIVLAIWLALRWLRKSWDFNLVVGLAWTWITNVFTLGPVYYVFLLTGQIMLGRADGPVGYDAFIAQIDQVLDIDAGFLESFWLYVLEVFRLWGVPMFVGSIPWAIVIAVLGYWWSLVLIRRINQRRAARAAAAARNWPDMR